MIGLRVCYMLHRYVVMTRKCFALAKLNEDIMAGPCTFIGWTVGWNLVLRCKLWIYVRVKKVVVMVTVMGTGLGFVSDVKCVCSHQTFTAHIKLISVVKSSSCINFETCTINIWGMLGHQTSEYFDNSRLCVCVLFIWGPKCNNFPSRLLRKKNTKQKQVLLSSDLCWMWVYLESYTAASPLSTQVLFWPGVQDQISSR